MDVAIDSLKPSELHLVLSSWKRSYRDYCPQLAQDAYYRLQGAVCDEILSRFPLLLAARDPDAPAVVLGWICAEPAQQGGVLVHYAYVKQAYRRQNIAKRLLLAALEHYASEDGGLFYTHRTASHAVADRYGLEYLPIAKALRRTRSPA